MVARVFSFNFPPICRSLFLCLFVCSFMPSTIPGFSLTNGDTAISFLLFPLICLSVCLPGKPNSQFFHQILTLAKVYTREISLSHHSRKFIPAKLNFGPKRSRKFILAKLNTRETFYLYVLDVCVLQAKLTTRTSVING